jgi:hypothetical protein
MVQNSLGRLWLEGHPEESLRMKWRYYMDEAQQEPDVAAKLAEIRKGYAAMQLEDIKLLDPCMGSGHILVYAFDMLMEIYRTMGYTDRDAVRSIVEQMQDAGVEADLQVTVGRRVADVRITMPLFTDVRN